MQLELYRAKMLDTGYHQDQSAQIANDLPAYESARRFRILSCTRAHFLDFSALHRGGTEVRCHTHKHTRKRIGGKHHDLNRDSCFAG